MLFIQIPYKYFFIFPLDNCTLFRKSKLYPELQLLDGKAMHVPHTCQSVGQSVSPHQSEPVSRSHATSACPLLLSLESLESRLLSLGIYSRYILCKHYMGIKTCRHIHYMRITTLISYHMCLQNT